MLTTREKLHELIDALPEQELSAVERYLESLESARRTSDLERALAHAPVDDEPETPEESDAVRKGREEMANGDAVPWEEVKRRLGLRG
jgi:hypothetical protein